MTAARIRPLLLAAACAAAGVGRAQGPAPAPASQRTAPRVSEADIQFMQGMIGHHAQAVQMAHLVPSRTANAKLRLLAERIDVAQQQEIAQMGRWLEGHGAKVPAIDTGETPGHGHAAMGGMAGMGKPSGNASMLMPGMLSAAQMDTLRGAQGAAFDRYFLRYMIQHHEGALAMVAKLFSTQASGQEPAINEFANDVDAGQRAEIARMRALLKQVSATR